MDTFATPGTPIKRGLITQRASTEISIRDIFFEVNPITMHRFTEERGLTMAGGVEMLGNPVIPTSLSCTI
jgi:hypothetical protein